MIKSIVLQPLRNGEFIQFLTDFLVIVDKNNPDNLQVRPAFEALKSLTDDMENLFKISQASIITRDIEGLDERRDRAVNGISTVATGFAYSFDPVVSRHARTLEAHFKLFGSGIAKDNYQSQTTSIRNILDDWETKQPLKEAITALNLDSWKAELQAANEDFYTAYTSRNEELASSNPDNLKGKRLASNAAYYKLRDRLNAHFEINDGAEPWARTISLANQSIDNYNALLARRGPDTPAVVEPPLAEAS